MVSNQGNEQYLEYRSCALAQLIIGGRDVPDIVEESEKERIEAMEAKLAESNNKKEKVRV